MDGNGARLFPPSSDRLLKHASRAIQNNFYSYGPLIEEKKRVESHINTWNPNFLQISVCYNLDLAFINERCHASSGNCNCETIFSPAEDSWIDGENQVLAKTIN